MSASVERAEDSEWLDHAVRIGLVAYGLVHLLIAWLALQLAFGAGSGSASQKGALAELARQPFGKVLVGAVAVGLALLVVWRGLEATVGHEEEEGADRVKKRIASAGKGVLYAVLAFSAAKVALGSQSSSRTDTMTAKVMNVPGGQVLVVLIGLGIVGYGGFMVVYGWTEKYAKHLDAEGKSGDTGKAYLFFGKAGYIAKGLSVGVVGVLFVWAGLTHEARKSGGLDQALRTVLDQPYGRPLLVLIALGIGCYGLFCFARARHLSR